MGQGRSFLWRKFAYYLQSLSKGDCWILRKTKVTLSMCLAQAECEVLGMHYFVDSSTLSLGK